MCKFEVVSSKQTLQSLVFSKPEYYQYITLERGFYLLDNYNEAILGLRSAAGIASKDFAPDRNDFIPLQFFTPEEQVAIREAQMSPVCMCPICVSLRKELDARCQGIKTTDPTTDEQETQPIQQELSCLEVRIELYGDTLEQVCREWFKGLTTAGFPKVFAWCVQPLTNTYSYQLGGLDQALETIVAMSESQAPPTIADFQLSNDPNAELFGCNTWESSIWMLDRDPLDDGRVVALCVLRTFINKDENRLSEIPQYLSAAAELCRHFLRLGKLHQAKFCRSGSVFNFLPEPPLVTSQYASSVIYQIIVTNKAEVEENYDRPEVFWQAWDNIEQHGEQYLCLRGMDCAGDGLLFSRIVESHWELASAAKSGLVRNYDEEDQEY